VSAPHAPGDWDTLFADRLDALRQFDQLRRRRIIEPIDATHVRIGETAERIYVNFSSNDYLGLAHHPAVVAAWKNAADRWGVGSGASSLISGYGPAHQSAERAIARWKKTPAAVLLPSGYQANCVAVQTLATIAATARVARARPDAKARDPWGRGYEQSAHPSVRFLIDKLAHASLLDAVRATGAPFRIFPHNHLAKLRRLLSESPADQRQVVLTESIFSMDGDSADLAGLAELKQSAPFFLLLDEAHASGVFGPGGAGLAAEMKLEHAVDAYVVTLSKALGVVGGAICGSRAFADAAVNLGRGLIFSTSVPPGVAAAAEAAIAVLADEPVAGGRQQRVRRLADHVRQELAAAGWLIPHGESPIVPIVIGAESAALAASDTLLENGFLVPAVRPPAVPRGASRLRVTLSSEHSDDEIEGLIAAVGKLRV
jgi:8-amino-7-oxononanoate synthase